MNSNRNIKKIIWQPQPRQCAFMERPEYEVCYGGAAGGGKSDALLAEALRQVSIRHYKGIIFRKTYKQLTELEERSRVLYLAAYPGAKYNSTKHVWSFPSGAKIYFGAMQHTKDRINYQGKAYDFIGFDELTHFTWEEYSYMFSRNRPSGPGTRVYMRSTTNPGGIGHAWVKARFITAADPMTRIIERIDIIEPDGTVRKVTRSRMFVPATIYDNKKLLENDPNYIANLALLPEADRKALMMGDWNSFNGQVFTEFVDDPDHYNDGLWTHVVEPFQIPKHWIILRGFDFGYSKPFSVGWYAVDTKGKMYKIREYYGCTGVPNEGIKIEPTEIARRIRDIERQDPNLIGRDIIGIADPSIYDESRGQSVGDMMAASPNFVTWIGANNARLSGKMQFHFRLAFDEYGEPNFQVFNTCKHFIRTTPNLVYSLTDTEDIDTSMEDHIYDETRYTFMHQCIAPQANFMSKHSGFDPLNLSIPPKVKTFYM